MGLQISPDDVGAFFILLKIGFGLLNLNLSIYHLIKNKNKKEKV